MLGMIMAALALPAGWYLAFHAGRRDDARRWLSAFVERSEGGRPALAIALDGEIALARATLARLA